MSVEYDKHFEKLFEIWIAAEKEGYHRAEYCLGILFLSTGKAELLPKAVALLKRAAKQKYAFTVGSMVKPRKQSRNYSTYAMFALGRCYENGLGVRRNYKSALKWYKAAEANITSDLVNYPDPWGDAESARISRLINNEAYFGEKASEEDALFEDISRANEGDAAAQNRLGHRYYYGQGVEKNVDLALELLKESARGEIEAAIHKLADHFESEGNYKEAARYFRAYTEIQIKDRRRRLGW